MTRVHRLLALTLLAAAVVVGIAIAVSNVWEESGEPERPWAEGSVHGSWRSVFDGHGENIGRHDGLALSPRPAREPGETHAGLIVSTRQYEDVDFRAKVRTLAQLRTPEPNPWEVPWLVWAYNDPEHFYYITLKPNGWELGKRDPAYPGGQRFLATGAEHFPIGRTSDVRVAQRGARIEVSVDGRGLVGYADRERPYLKGNVGVYTEDARVLFTDLSVRAPE
ncbi:calcium-binding protein [Streptomyces cinnamoneus]|uniref:Calcium-binding protein n=1 Tax=Streptomyces cinnamoneus TaxID=53446 RepID=A0A2G1XQB6_STRCJ|nr:calcium-binding protein [Streptomyces cinnamoneus]PHQ53435.1 calcium-binding protein [Streptomyces cinnamoneus]PPT12739.1 calcium-binding protein [Streptomyces cinnamoneus]